MTVTMTIEEYLDDRVENQINWYDKKSTYNRKWYQGLKILEIVLAALTPFLILISDDSLSLQLIAATIAIFIAIVAGILIVFKYHEKWIQYRSTCEQLKQEKYLFLTKSGIYHTATAQIFVQQIETIISKENLEWVKLITIQETQPSSDPGKTK